jgi:RHS repeat-associated protein
VYEEGSHSPDLMLRGGSTYRLVKDQVGSVVRVVEAATGNVVQEREYDAWGAVLVDSNPGWQPFGFAGGLLDAGTGLTRFGARDYEPTVGRWTSKDAVRQSGGLNFYVYVGNDPQNKKDPTGNTPEQEFCAVACIYIAGAVSAYAYTQCIAAGKPLAYCSGFSGVVLTGVFIKCFEDNCTPPPAPNKKEPDVCK